jgi:mannose-6-phosphate isomerase-like protein (cupin superfamily)
MYVVSGSGIALVNAERIALREGTLLLIQRGEMHEIRNTGKVVLKTLNVYIPPAYTHDGKELPAGKSG